MPAGHDEAARRVIPIATDRGEPGSACSGAEPFALMVLGGSMRPEFDEGDVVVIEPEGLATDGAYVLANADGEWILRQLVAAGAGWELRALASGHPAIALPNLDAVRGVVIQKSRPGRRRDTKRYGP